MAETCVDQVIARNRTAEALPRTAYAPSEERLRSVGADIEAEKGRLDKLRGKLDAANGRIVTLEAQAAARVAAAAPAPPEGLVVATLRRQLAEEQTKRVQAESALAWLLRDLKALSDKLTAELQEFGPIK